MLTSFHGHRYAGQSLDLWSDPGVRLSGARIGSVAKQGPRMQATAIILAAGLGTRMKSSVPKTLHRLAGRSMLRHLLASCETVFDRTVVVLGPDMEAVRKEAEPHVCVVQRERLGTAHAALQAAEHF